MNITPHTFLGIDPGASGAIAALSPDFQPVAVFDYDRELCASWVRSIAEQQNILAFIEHVHAMPQNGAVSLFNFGATFGWSKEMAESLRPCEEDSYRQTFPRSVSSLLSDCRPSPQET